MSTAVTKNNRNIKVVNMAIKATTLRIILITAATITTRIER